MNAIYALPTALILVTGAPAQSTIFGMDLWNGGVFTTATDQFNANYTALGANGFSLFALDFDAAATTLWGVTNNGEYGPINLDTGDFSPLGIIPGLFTGASGLTASPDGVTWYLSSKLFDDTELYAGDVTTGTFQLVGRMGVGLIGEIAMDSGGNLYGLSITDNSLYQIDPVSAAASLVGPVGFPTNSVQGMDFDWSTGLLYGSLNNISQSSGVFASIDVASGAATQLEVLTMRITVIAIQESTQIGTVYCPAALNSTGSAAEISAIGLPVASGNNLVLRARSLPSNSFGFFLNSQSQGFVANPGGSQGNLCLGGAIGRYVGPGQIKNSGDDGAFSLVLDLTQTPTPSGPVAVTGGQTWNFQSWYRDSSAAGPTSNFTNGVSISFQ